MASLGNLSTAWFAGTVGTLSRVSPAQTCQAIFVMAAAAILAMTVLPTAMQASLLDYGARDQTKTAPRALSTGRFSNAIAVLITRWQVPHAWFSSFYILYLALAVFWAVQWLSWTPQAPDGPQHQFGSLFGWMVHRQTAATDHNLAVKANLTQLYLVASFEALQAARRLYEHLFIFRQSSASTMSAAHLLAGYLFYAGMSVAVWVEGSQTILDAKRQPLLPPTSTRIIEPRVAIGVPIFLACWWAQFWCHTHLASLKKYSLPSAGPFRYIVCPHYTLEVALYVTLASLAATSGQIFNRTLLSSVLFILVNLGVTAHRSKQWYAAKFGAQSVAGKWRIVPFVF